MQLQRAEMEFDPCELIGTHVPFLDPFKYDDNDFRALPFTPRPNLHPMSHGVPLANLRSRSVLETAVPIPTTALSQFQELFPPPHDILLAAIALNTHLELPELPEARERTRLTADQAISIFNQRRTKTSRTAALLAAKYSISSKAIRDIWTLKSWATETRPHWSNFD